MDIFGDENSGDVVYSCQGETLKCTYELQTTGGNRSTILGEPVEVLPRTVYDEVADELDHYVSMEARMRCDERFISKSERDGASTADFAGKNKTFPILKPEDVIAAVRSIGRAGSENYNAGTLKANIVKIAKRKNWSAQLPKAWQGGASESAPRTANEGARVLAESLSGTVFPLTEANVPRVAKIISPGWGSSGYYPAEVLKRDGPNVFKSGMHMYMNHATAQEESARPEGDLNGLAGVLTGNAFWDEAHREGPGLYAPIDVFTRYAHHVAETAPYTGLSIRARGIGKEGTAEGKTGFVIEKITHGESVDFVTHPGRGGKALTESGSPGTETELKESATMTDAEIKALVESGVRSGVETATKPLIEENGRLKATVLKFQQRGMTEDARRVATAVCGNPELRLSEAVQDRIVKRVVVLSLPLTEAGDLDEAKFKTIVEGEVKDEVAYLATLGGGTVRNLGESAPADPTELKPEEALKRMEEAFIAQGYTPDQAKTAAKGRVN